MEEPTNVEKLVAEPESLPQETANKGKTKSMKIILIVLFSVFLLSTLGVFYYLVLSGRLDFLFDPFIDSSDNEIVYEEETEVVIEDELIIEEEDVEDTSSYLGLEWEEVEVVLKGGYGDRVLNMILPVGFEQVDNEEMGSTKIVYGDAFLELYDFGECYPYTITEYRALELNSDETLVYLEVDGILEDGYRQIGTYTTLLSEESCQPNELDSTLEYPCVNCGSPYMKTTTATYLKVKDGLLESEITNYLDIFDEVLRKSYSVTDTVVE